MEEGPVDRAAITFEAPHGTESVVLRDGDVAEFGRAGTCAVRFAYAPVVDTGVPRIAGRLVVAGGRVFVEASDAPGHSALEISAAGRPPVLLAGGDGFAPSQHTFRVKVHGRERSWALDVAIAPVGPADESFGADEPTERHHLELTDAQRRVLEAYISPIRRGRLEPATHREVADRLGCHPNSAREVLYTVWSALFAAGIPMPEVADKRVAVAETIRLHRLL